MLKTVIYTEEIVAGCAVVSSVELIEDYLDISFSSNGYEPSTIT